MTTVSPITLTTCLIAFAIPFCAAANAQILPHRETGPVSPQPAWKTGNALTRALNGPAAVAWTEAPFADRVKAFAASKGIAVYVDRRIDPSLKTNIRETNVTVEQLFLAVATEQGIGMCRLDDLIYFGPLEITPGLAISWEQLPRLKPATQSTLSWERLSTPRYVLRELARTHEIKIAGADRIGHDLWPAGSYPALMPAQQVALVAIGFGLWPVTNEYHSRTLNLVRWDPPAGGTIEYPRELSRKESTQLKRVLKKEFRDVKFQVSKKSVRMTGQASDLHAAGMFLIRRNSIAQPQPGDIRFTLKTSATRWQILNAIATQTGRTVKCRPSERSLLAQQLELECHQLTLEEVVQRVVADTGLNATISDSAIELQTN